MKRIITLSIALATGLCACSPGVFVVKKVDPAASAATPGFRYYMPRPYLLVTNMTVAPTPVILPSGASQQSNQKSSDNSANQQQKPAQQSDQPAPGSPKPGSPAPKDVPSAAQGAAPENRDAPQPQPTFVQAVTMEIIWLPDFDHEYAVTMEGGRTGTFNGGLQLADGWMLIGVNEQTDSGTAQTIQAAGGFLGSVLSAAGLGAAGAKSANSAETVFVQVPQEPFLLLFRIDDKGKTLEEVDTCRANELLAMVANGNVRLGTQYGTHFNNCQPK